MTNPYFHESSTKRLKELVRDLPQSLLISGPVGIGLSSIYSHLSQELSIVAQVVLPERDEKIDIERGVISVESIRRLYDQTKTIETNKRLVVIDYAERMGTQAQNAFLKLLEEPGINTHFMLLTHQPARLLPTVRSRTQHFELQSISTSQSEQLLDDLGITNAQKRSQLLFIADGLPAELSRLAHDKAYFDGRVELVKDARLLLQGNAYDRLKLAHKYKDDRSGALVIIDDALKMLRQNIETGKTELLPKIDRLLQVSERLNGNGNVRLQIATIMV